MISGLPGSTVCIAPYVPFEGIDHAGGEYLLRYLETLMRHGIRVTLLAPDREPNRNVADRAPKGLDVILFPDGRARFKVQTAFRLLVRGIDAQSGRRWFRSLPEAARQRLAECDLIDLQWTEAISVAPTLRSAYGPRPITATCHDVHTQSVRRGHLAHRHRARLAARLASVSIARREAQWLSASDHVFVFKREDVTLLAEMRVDGPVATVPPYVDLSTSWPRPEDSSQTLIFSAAFHRAENSEAAEWLLDQVMPVVTSQVPGVRVRIAGSSPPPALAARASAGIEVTGYLPELSSAFTGCLAVVVPLLRGAGLKFKVAQALAAGFPVVTTDVGAEGIESNLGVSPTFVCNDPLDFANALIGILKNPRSAIERAGETARSLRLMYDFERDTMTCFSEAWLTVSERSSP